MCLEKRIRKLVELGDYKKEQLNVLNYVKQVTKDNPNCIFITEEEWGNIPPILFVILDEMQCFKKDGGLPPLTPGYYGLSEKGETYRQKLEKFLKEYPQ